MDRQLLDALSNIGAALEQLTEALNERSSMKSDVGQALQGGDFGKQLEEISVGIKSIKDDTKKILDNQQTIIQLQKEQSSSDTKVFEEAGGGKTKQMIKDGVAVIALIAGAVLAIGLAFSIIGTVDFLSVIAISAAIPLIAIAFEKVASIEGLTPEKVFVTGLALVGMSIAIAASSIILQTVQPIGIFQALTIVFIGVAFGAAAYGIGQLIKGFEGINPAQALLASMILPIILIATSAAIAASSVILQQVQPIGLFQALTVVLIAAAFGVAAFGLGKLIRSFEGINPAVALVAAVLMPLVLVGLSLAITESSKILQDVQVIGLFQAISAIFIAGVLVVLSYAVKPLMQGVKGIDFLDIIKGGLVILGLVSVLTLSSKILQEYEPVEFGKLFNLVIMSISVSISVMSMALVIAGLSKLGITFTQLFMGGISIIVLSGVIAATSHILSLGNYSNYPSFSWSLGVGTSLLLFAIPTAALGALIMATGGLAAGALLLGAGAVVGIATLFPIIDSIISTGTYTKYPGYDWSMGVGLSLVGLAIGVSILGVISSVGAAVEGITKFLPIPTIENPITAGMRVVGDIAGLMPIIDSIVSTGTYTKYPGYDWSMGVGLSLVGLAIGVAVLGVISSVGAAVENITDWIPFVKIENPIDAGIAVIPKIAGLMPIIDSIISTGSYDKYPGEDWAKGVGMTLVYFSIAVAVLGVISSAGAAVENITKFIPGVKVENPITAGMGAVLSIAGLMPVVDKIISVGSYDKYPGEDWAKGVGTSLVDFSIATALLGVIKKETFDSGLSRVTNLSRSIASVSKIINSGKFDNYPEKDYVDGLLYSFKKFSSISSFKTSFISSIRSLASSITTTSLILSRGKFDKYPQKEYIDGVIYALKKFSTIVSLARGLDSGPGLLARGFAAITGGVGKSPLDKAVSNIEKLATAFEKMGSAFKNLSGSIDEIDAGKLDMIRSMSSNVVMLSLMDPTQFNNMMDALEERGGIFADLMKDFEEKKAQSPTVTTGGGVSVGVEKSKSDIEVLGGKMDSMIAILGDMSQVMGSGGTLNTYLNSIKENQLDGDRHRSDIRLKNIISNLGKSSLGINIYTFEYKFNPGIVYQGVIAQELLGTEFEMALVKDKSGFYSVDYSVIDVIFKKVETIS